MSHAQRRALFTLLGLIVAGHAVRTWLLGPGQPPGSVTLLQPASDATVARQRASAQAAARPLRPGERIDLNSADAATLTRLPGVGAGLARRIVDDRGARGPFRTVAELDRVPGIGPALLKRVQEFVVQGRGEPGLPGDGPSSRGTQGGGDHAGTPDPPAGQPLDLNLASEADLLRLPGIGPTKARAIVAYRQARGPFAAVADLVKVPGIGPATLAGLAGLVRIR